MNAFRFITGTALALIVGSSGLMTNPVLASELPIVTLPSLPSAASVNVSVGTFKEGQDVGLRNGGLMAARISKRVLAQRGCAGVGQLQYALGTVVANLHAPLDRSSAFTAGFFNGYVRAIGQSVANARATCRLAEWEDGSFPGELMGGVYCQVAEQYPEALSDLVFGPIYDGWSSSQAVQSECVQAFNDVTLDCAATGIAAELLNASQNAACAL